MKQLVKIFFKQHLKISIAFVFLLFSMVLVQAQQQVVAKTNCDPCYPYQYLSYTPSLTITYPFGSDFWNQGGLYEYINQHNICRKSGSFTITANNLPSGHTVAWFTSSSLPGIWPNVTGDFVGTGNSMTFTLPAYDESIYYFGYLYKTSSGCIVGANAIANANSRSIGGVLINNWGNGSIQVAPSDVSHTQICPYNTLTIDNSNGSGTSCNIDIYNNAGLTGTPLAASDCLGCGGCTTLTYQPTTTGTLYVVADQWPNGGGVNSKSCPVLNSPVVVSVVSPPSAPLSAVVSSVKGTQANPACIDGNVTFTATGCSGGQIHWFSQPTTQYGFIDDGASITMPIYGQTTVYAYCYNPVSQCYSSGYKAVTAYTRNDDATFSFNSPACVGSPVNFSIDNGYTNPTYTFQWYFNGGTPSSSTSATPSVTFAQPSSSYNNYAYLTVTHVASGCQVSYESSVNIWPAPSITATATRCSGTNSNIYTLAGQVTFTNPPSTGTLTISVEGGQSVVFSAPFVSPKSYSISNLIADGASRTVTATFSASPTCPATTSFTAPASVGTGFSNFPIGTTVSNFLWGTSPYPQQSWNNGYVPGLGGPYDFGGGIHDLDLTPPGVTDIAAVCGELAEGVAGGSGSNYYNKYKYIPLEYLARGTAGQANESQNIPAGGIGKVRAGMLRFLFDQYYTSTNANNWTVVNGAAFQLAVWEIIHEKYNSNTAFSVNTASNNGFYFLATYNLTAITQAQTYVTAVNNKNWTDAQWMAYQPVNWHVIAAENNTALGGNSGQDLVFAQPIVCVSCSTPTLGGASSVCVGSTATVTPTTGGTWASSNTGVATITNAGVVTGVAAGTVILTYTSSAGCSNTMSFTVNVKPTVSTEIIAQPTCTVPTGTVRIIPSPSLSGNWTVTVSPGGATYTASGTAYNVTGLAPGTYTFTVTSASGCVSNPSGSVVINAVPAGTTLGGDTEVCIGFTGLVTPNSGGTWTSSNTAIATVTNAGVIQGISAGTVTLTFTNSSGCISTKSLIVNNCIHAENDINQTPMNTTVTGQLLTNDEGVAGVLSASIGGTNIPLATATTVAGVNDAGTAVTNAGTITINSNGTYTFVPATGFHGTINPITYIGGVSGSATDDAILSIEVLPRIQVENNPPVAQNDVASTEAGTAVSSTVMNNDSDPDGHALIVISASIGGTNIPLGTATTVSGVNAAGTAVPNAGTITLNANGTYTFNPATGFIGAINDITYTISDQNGTPGSGQNYLTDVAIIKINVFPNTTNATYANDDANIKPQGTSMSGNVLTNDSDPENNTPTITSVSYGGTSITIGAATPIAGVGTFTLSSTGTYTFVPLSTFVGTAIFIYNKCDNGSPQACDEASIYLTSVPALIIAENDINQTPMNTTVTGQLMTNDEGVTSISSATIGGTNIPFGSATVVAGVNDAGVAVSNAGLITINSNGTYSFSGTNGFTGTINPINYVGAGLGGVTDNAILSIEVTPFVQPGNNPPVAQNDVATTEVNITVSSNVLPNDSDPDGNTLTISSASVTLGTATQVAGVNNAGVAVPNAGTITLNTNGTYTFVPTANFIGTINDITYTISDGNGGTDSAILSINVLQNIGNSTYANDDANSAPQGTTMTGNVLTNDTDPEGHTHTVASVTIPAQTINGVSVSQTVLTIGTATAIPNIGNITINTNGTYTFIPVASFTGTLRVPYRKVDGGTPSVGDDATLYLTCIPRAIIAENDINQTLINTTVAGQLMTNDEGVTSISSANIGGVNIPLGTGGTVSGIDDSGTAVANAGFLVINSNGTYSFSPAQGFIGTINPITYVGAGIGGATDNAILSIEVLPKILPGNNPPVAQNDVATTEVNTAVSSNVLPNDSDPDGNALTVISATASSGAITIGTSSQISGVNSGGIFISNAGSIVLNANGTYTFTPVTGFVGTIFDITYTISDGNGATDTAILNINVLPNNGNTTFANDDANAKPQGVTMTGNILTNDTDPEGNTQTVTTVTANGVNIPIGTATAIPSIGTLTVSSTGVYTFVPISSYYGTILVPYTKCDNGTPQACDEATLYLTSIYRVVIAENDINQTPMNTAVTGQLMTNDEGVTSIASAQNVTGGNISLGVATIVSGVDDSGTPVTNAGTITINNNGTYTFTPVSGFTGTINPITYTGAGTMSGVPDAYDTAILSIEVLPKVYTGNNPPVAQDDVASTEVNTAVSSNVLPNDSDPDGNTLTVTSATYLGGGIAIGTSTVVSGVNLGSAAVTNAGSIVLNSNGTYTFTPAAGFVGTINDITYTISDGNGGTDTAILSINVLPNNGNSTFANDDANAKPQGTTMTGNILTNDTDPEGNTQTVTIVTANGTNIPIGTATAIPSVGTLTVTSAGAYTFVPLAGFTGNVTVPYTKCDNGSPQACDQATLYLTCLPRTIIAENDINQTPLNTAVSGQLMTNDEGVTSISSATIGGSNIPLATATVVAGVNDAGTAVSNAGSITINSNGTYTFTPATGFTGTINPITYVGAGANGATDNAILSIEVLPKKTSGNNPPIAQNDVNSTEVNVTITGSTILNNDSDPDGNALTITAASIGGSPFTFGTAKVVSGVNLNGTAVANAGSLTINANGTYTYVPTAGFTGTVNDVNYTISDGNGGTDAAILSINVLPNNGNTTFANDDANVKPQGITMTGNVLPNDFDPEGHSHTVSSASVNGTALSIGSATILSGIGSLTLNTNGTYTFVPLASYVGTFPVIYIKCDNGSPVACDEATLYLTCIPSTKSCLVSNKNVTPKVK